MNIALKKIELIEWLVRLQDESLIQRIENLKTSSAKDRYEQRTPKTIDDLQTRLDKSAKDISVGMIHSQQEVEDYFEAKFKL